MWIADKLIYRYNDSFIRAYQGSELVWELSSGVYYVKWTPSSLTGTFDMFGQTYSFQDYLGDFRWRGSSVVTSYAFQGAGIKRMWTNVATINANAFENCKSLYRAELPECKILGSYAFQSCTSLTSMYLPKATTISSLALENTGFYLDLILEGSSVCTFYGNIFGSIDGHMIFVPPSLVSTYISRYPSYYHPSAAQGVFPSYPAFASLHYIKWTPDITGTGTFSLMWQSNTYTYKLSNYTYENYFYNTFGVNGVVGELNITSSAFKNKTSLTTIETDANIVGDSAFYGCTGLKTVTLTKCKTIGLYAFASCTSMESLILGNSSICHLVGNSTALYSNNTKIYVPASLVNTYKSDPLWSYYKYRIFSIR